MLEPGCLETVDRTDFEHTLHEALGAPDIREALRRPTAQVTEGQLRSRALAAADTIAAEAATEYAALLRLRTAAVPDRPGRPRRSAPAPAPAAPAAPAAVGNGLPAALAVLTPVLSVVAAVVFLFLGYGLHLAGVQQPLADTLISAGWVAGAVAVLAAAVAGAGLVVTAVRHRATPHRPQPDTASVAQAHAEWRRALLERGMLPFLRRQLRRVPTREPRSRSVPPPERRRTRPGYSSPDFTGPTYSSRD
ncbi:hypothetical protein ACWZEH_11345 [Streptomyces sp. QTS137]